MHACIYADLVHDMLAVLIQRVAMIVGHEFFVFSECQLEIHAAINVPAAAMQQPRARGIFAFSRDALLSINHNVHLFQKNSCLLTVNSVFRSVS